MDIASEDDAAATSPVATVAAAAAAAAAALAQAGNLSAVHGDMDFLGVGSKIRVWMSAEGILHGTITATNMVLRPKQPTRGLGEKPGYNYDIEWSNKTKVEGVDLFGPERDAEQLIGIVPTDLAIETHLTALEAVFK